MNNQSILLYRKLSLGELRKKFSETNAGIISLEQGNDSADVAGLSHVKVLSTGIAVPQLFLGTINGTEDFVDFIAYVNSLGFSGREFVVGFMKIPAENGLGQIAFTLMRIFPYSDGGFQEAVQNASINWKPYVFVIQDDVPDMFVMSNIVHRNLRLTPEQCILAEVQEGVSIQSLEHTPREASESVVDIPFDVLPSNNDLKMKHGFTV